MPMIRGRYYMNPAMGQALEEARARAEEGNAPRGSEEEIADGGEESRRRDARERDGRGRFAAPGPVRHVEIECAEGGYIARLHRHPPSADGDGRDGDEREPMASRRGSDGVSRHDAAGMPSPPEVHVFSHHHDLVDFLREELGKHKTSRE